MKLAVEAQGELRKYIKGGQKRMEVEVADGTTVAVFLAQLGITEGESWNAALNGRLVYPEDPLIDGAVLLIFRTIAGGQK
jgi:sulfur carrier protein ThiS